MLSRFVKTQVGVSSNQNHIFLAVSESTSTLEKVFKPKNYWLKICKGQLVAQIMREPLHVKTDSIN